MSVPQKVIFFVSLLVLCVSSGVLIHYYAQGEKAQKDFASLKVGSGYDLSELHKQNSDIVGWIRIKDTKVDYPVMQTKSSPEYYLRRNFKKEYSMAGTPFMDAASDISLPTKNWLIYGHNMKNGTMFHDILEYEDSGFYKKHRTFIFDTIKGKGIWEVVAVFRSKVYDRDSKKFKYYEQGGITTAEELKNYISRCKALSEYDTGVSVSGDDQVITLSTCAYHTEEGRFAVVAKRVK